jgi:ribosomal protein S12 methylthiotransferase accessory factor
MLVKVATLIDGHRTVLDIVCELRECAQSQDVFHVLFILSDWGLIVPNGFKPQTVVCWQRPEAANGLRSHLETCEPFLRSLVSINPDDDFPVFSYAAIPNRPDNESGKEKKGLGNQQIYTAGSGFTRQEGVLAALGELVETMGVTRTDGVKITRATVKEVDRKGIHPSQLLMFSERQYENRERWRNRYGERHQIPFPVQNNVPLDWVTVTSYPDKKSYLVPAGYCYLNYPRDRNYLVANSNGCAAAPTRTEAIVSGFLELVERDAVAIWWYNRIPRPTIDPVYFNDPELDECVHWMNRHNRLFYALDLTHDYNIPVIAAISVNGEETDIAMGFGANFDCLSAVKSAVREMLQLYALKRIIEKQIASGGVESLDQSARAFISWAHGDFVKTHSYMRPGGMNRSPQEQRSVTRPRDSEEALQSCTALCRQKNQKFFVLDFTPPSFKVPVVRIIVPGMRHFRARFAPGRLYQVPVSMGWRSTAIRENDLNQFPILI